MRRSKQILGLSLWSLAVALFGAAAPALGQTLPDVELEGPISAPATANSVTVMGAQIVVPGGTFDTPRAKGIPLSAMGDPLPGRPTGFIGGTAIVTGTSTGGIVTADTVFSDVSENVVVGEVTEVTPVAGGDTIVRLDGIRLTPLKDPRLAASAHTELGFAIVVDSIATKTLAAVEGYWSENDQTIYYHDLAADTATLVHPDQDEVSIIRARCVGKGTRLEIRGGAHPPIPAGPTPPVATGQVRVSVIAGTPQVEVLGTELVESVGLGFGRWRLRVLDNPALAESDGQGGTRCRKDMRLKAELLNVNDTVLAEVQEDVEIR